MDISKIKEFLKNKPRWVVILVSIVCIFVIGSSVWFGVSACASVDLDKLNVHTDKVQIDVEGVTVQPKDVSSFEIRDDVLKLCDYFEVSSSNMLPCVEELL